MSVKAAEKTGSRADAEGRPCVLYYFLDADGDVLYVGMSEDFRTRRATHAASKNWFSLVADEVLLTFPDRATCAAVEALMIHALRPPHNVAAPNGGRCGTLSDRAMDHTPPPVEWVRRLDEARSEIRAAEDRAAERAAQATQWKRRYTEQVRRARWAENEISRNWQAWLRPSQRHAIGEWIWNQLGRVAHVERFGGDREEALRKIARTLTDQRVAELESRGANETDYQMVLPLAEFVEGSTNGTLRDYALGADLGEWPGGLEVTSE